MKTIACVIGFLLLAPVVSIASGADNCPQREYGWTNAVGGEKYEDAEGIAVDDDGNVYVSGEFFDECDFDPGPRRDRRRSKGDRSDIYITSYGPDGSYRWTAAMGGKGFDYGHSVAMTLGGDVAVTGAFSETVDFDPSRGGKDRHKAKGDRAVFVTVLDTDGSYRWTRTFGGPGSALAWSIAVDPEGNMLLTGDFSETADFDPSRGVDRHTSEGSADVFVTKLGRNGSYRWTRTWGGSQVPGDSGWDIAADAEGNVIVTGVFHGTVDFDPGEGEDRRVSKGDSDFFVTKLGPDGSYHWTYAVGGASADMGLDLTTDNAGNVFATGYFAGPVDFDPEGEGDVRDGRGAFVVKLDELGSVNWVRTTQGASAYGHGIAVDESRDLLVVSGGFYGSVDLDPTPGEDWHTSNGDGDLFIMRLTPDGDYQFTDSFGGSERDLHREAVIDPEGNVLTCGHHLSVSVDFDPTTGLDERWSNGQYDFFVTKHYCGSCEAVERHFLTVRTNRTLKAEVRALVPGGGVTVECAPTDPPGEPIETNVKINNDNTGKYKLKKLAKGEYACAITEVRDADGNIVCDEPAGRRVVNVK